MTDVFYLIEPNEDSVQKILNDFPAKDDLDYD